MLVFPLLSPTVSGIYGRKENARMTAKRPFPSVLEFCIFLIKNERKEKLVMSDQFHSLATYLVFQSFAPRTVAISIQDRIMDQLLVPT